MCGEKYSVSAHNGVVDEELLSLGPSTDAYSNFSKDTNVPHGRYSMLQDTWLQRCISREGVDEVLIAKEVKQNRTVGMIAVNVQGNVGNICELAVCPQLRRKGLGKLLMRTAFTWFYERGITCVGTHVQEENSAALRLCQSTGGIACTSVTDCHFWLGDDPFNDLKHSEIPYSIPYIGESESTNVLTVLQSKMINTNWHFGPLCEELLQNEIPNARSLLVTSGTAALELSALCVDFEFGAEIIMPSYTFVSTANAFVSHGAVPVFVDIRSDTQNIDEAKIESAITLKTRAIVCVHYAGVACEMDTIMRIAKKYKLFVIEDNAHGIFGTYKGRKLGTIGDLGCLSFHYTKNFHCGEGGALLVNNRDLIPKALISLEKGTNRNEFLSGKVSKYFWVRKGGSFALSELNAAVLYAQLTSRDHILNERRLVWEFYNTALADLDDAGLLRRPFIPPDCVHNAHIYYIRVMNGETGKRLAQAAKDKKVGIFSHYESLHSSTGGVKYGRISGECVETELCAQTLFRLPLWVGISDREMHYVVETVRFAVSG